MKKITIFILALSCSAALSAQMVSDPCRIVLEKIQKENIAYQSMESSFAQVSYMEILDEEVASGGTFYYVKPEQILLKYTDKESAGNLMLIDGERFVMVGGGQYNETSAKTNARMRDTKKLLAACLSGNVMATEAVKIECREEGGFYVVDAEIDPKSDQSGIAAVTAHYDKKDFTISTLKYTEADGSYTIYRFKSKELNKRVDSEVFKVSKR